MNIRDEDATDVAAIASVIRAAFGRDDEVRLVERLRRDGDVVLSLVADEGEGEGEGAGADASAGEGGREGRGGGRGGGVIGHVLLSRMDAPFRALALAPLSVLPQRERRGVAAELTRAALERVSAGWDAVFVLGDPRYYERFGFRTDLAAGFASLYASPQLMVLPLGEALPTHTGAIDYPAAFAELD